MDAPIELKFFTDKITSYELKSSEGDSDFFIEGYASTTDLDLVGDVVTPKALNSMLEQIKDRTIKIDVEHESWKGGGSPNIIPIGKVVDARVDSKGLWVRVKMNNASSRFVEVWRSIKGGFIDAFSIAFNGVKAMERMTNGVATRVITDLHLLNIALTGNPANPACRMSAVMAKSLEYAQLETEVKESTPSQELNQVPEIEGKPFAGYEDFDACVRANGDKEDPKAYCATIMRATEKKEEPKVEEKSMEEIQTVSTKDLENLQSQINEFKNLEAKSVEKDEQITKLTAQMKALDIALNQLQLKTRAEMPEVVVKSNPLAKPLDLFR